jgi:hypothetical protein
MMTLVKYETKKLFGQIKGNALTAIIVAAFFLVGGYLSVQEANWADSFWIREVLTTVSFIGLGALMLILFFGPAVTSIMSYNKDLNGQHAVFEAYIPENGWKRVAAKYVSYLLLILSGVALSALIAWFTFQVVRLAAPQQVQFTIDESIIEIFKRMEIDKASAIFKLFNTLFGIVLSLAIGTTFFTFFITLYSTLRHQIKIAKGLTFTAAGITAISYGWISDRLFGATGPLKGQLFQIPTEAYFSLVLSLMALIFMGWMLEHKTEIK